MSQTHHTSEASSSHPQGTDSNLYSRIHLQLPEGDRFACPVCKEVFFSDKIFPHIKERHGITDICCKHCDAAFGDLFALFTHESRHKKSNVAICVVCDAYIKETAEEYHRKSFHEPSPDGLECGHMGRNRRGKLWTCHYNYNATRPGVMSRHLGDCRHRSLFCHRCQKHWQDNDSFSGHLQEHIQNHECLWCDEPRCHDENALRQHMDNTHLKTNCPFCVDWFGADGLQQHLTDKHPQHERAWENGQQALDSTDSSQAATNNVHQCNLCPSTYLTENELRRHQKIHKDPRHKCEICHKPFVRKDVRDIHVRRGTCGDHSTAMHADS